MKRTTLTRERIVEAALARIDADGLEAFSTRRLGRDLGVEAMSLYHHFPSKDDLLDAVTETLLLQIPLDTTADPWTQRLRRIVYAYRDLVRAHPHAFPLIAARRFNTPGSWRLLECLLGIFRDAGFTAEQSARCFRVQGYFLNGALLSELTILGRAPLANRSRIDAGEVSPDAFPRIVESGPFLGPTYLDATFEAGLDALERYFETLLAAT